MAKMVRWSIAVLMYAKEYVDFSLSQLILIAIIDFDRDLA